MFAFKGFFSEDSCPRQWDWRREKGCTAVEVEGGMLEGESRRRGR
jgi:hypothetical protein